jgi:protein TonB
VTRAERPVERRNLGLAIVFSLGVHAALGVVAWRPSLRRRSSANEARAQLPIGISVEPSVVPPAPEPPPLQAQMKAPALARRQTPASPRPAPPAAQPASPSAGEPPTASPAASPVDLTGQMLVSASTGPSAGGSSDSSRSGSGLGRGVEPSSNQGAGDGSGTGDESGRVSLQVQDWSCPWPAEADAEKIDEQTVVIRVVVAPSGKVESATVVSDPGHGFGPAALACALGTRFIPARDRAGRAIRAASPPIVVRFTR